ncbi:hypothetical protein SKAU_G00206780 [Synaphobranchus kaupii]|uniref:Integrase p58-like C-terminal domain-containing protein n=1 Tax=Synaphobranchus kaupii TaxID=118154 RepID=A0A9Q1F826_SYNKA|nr:hypothetical protein SKAU_G00206780 [Synaphobranchus kaupii]
MERISMERIRSRMAHGLAPEYLDALDKRSYSDCSQEIATLINEESNPQVRSLDRQKLLSCLVLNLFRQVSITAHKSNEKAAELQNVKVSVGSMVKENQVHQKELLATTKDAITHQHANIRHVEELQSTRSDLIACRLELATHRHEYYVLAQEKERAEHNVSRAERQLYKITQELTQAQANVNWWKREATGAHSHRDASFDISATKVHDDQKLFSFFDVGAATGPTCVPFKLLGEESSQPNLCQSDYGILTPSSHQKEETWQSHIDSGFSDEHSSDSPLLLQGEEYLNPPSSSCHRTLSSPQHRVEKTHTSSLRHREEMVETTPHLREEESRFSGLSARHQDFQGMFREVPQASTGFSPFELLYSWPVQGPLDLLKGRWEGADGVSTGQGVVQYVLQMRDRLERYREEAKTNLQEAQRTQKTWYYKQAHQRELQPGQKVLLLLPSSTSNLLPKWQGPYTVGRKMGPVTYEVLHPERGKASQTYHVKAWKERQEPSKGTALLVRQAEEEDDSEGVVEAWKGLGLFQWEPGKEGGYLGPPVGPAPPGDLEVVVAAPGMSVVLVPVQSDPVTPVGRSWGEGTPELYSPVPVVGSGEGALSPSPEGAALLTSADMMIPTL